MSFGAEFVLAGMAACGLLLFVAIQPRLLIPAFIALVWLSLPGHLYGGLPSPVELGGIVLLGVAAWRSSRRVEVAGPAIAILAVLAIAALASGLAAQEESLLPIDWLSALAFLLIAALLANGEDGVGRVAIALCLAGTFLGLGAIHSVLVGPSDLFPLNEGVEGVDPDRAAGPFGEANFFALSMACLVPFAVHLIVRGGALRWLGLFATLALAGGVIATGSRGGMLAFAVGLAGTWLALSRNRARAALAIAAVALAATPLIAAQFQSLDERPVEGRATENLVALTMFQDHPLTGVGNANFEILYRDYAREVGNDPRPVRAAHSLPLEIAAEQGLAGILAWATAGAILLRFVVSRGIWSLPLGRASVLALATYLTGSLFLQGSQLRLLFILAGLVLALGQGRAVALPGSVRKPLPGRLALP